MNILAIETSCDETSLALIEAKGGLRQPRFKVIKHIISSQIKIHRPFGGVVPNLAKREHLKNLPLIWKQFSRYKNKIDKIAVTVGPGLEPALWTGIEFAKILAKELKKPLIGVNHMEGHLYSSLLSQTSKARSARKTKKLSFPAIALVVSGGHTILLHMKSLTKWKNLGETRDDAAGEAFDKVARLLGLPYPGGPEIEKLARKGNPKAINFPRPMLRDKNYEFSFSGLKTSVLYFWRDNPKANKADIAASFQQAVIDVLVGKTIRAAKEFKTKSIILCGGVAASKALRQQLKGEAENITNELLVPDFEYNTDNAAMIGAAAYITLLRKKQLRLTAQGGLDL
ncbi:MAG: tRNA (adenosine(37)-N6)-threonylcarbamoyltransferase complex transferase subunit TsaD [bacterium]|nr:tRNA (adenosine(37)-N6)-threonylcarbamoyltransferase complex transferase subunit TsaD [bacterium]